MRNVLVISLLLFFAAISYSQTAEVIGDSAYLRGTAGEKGAIVDTLAPGTDVAIIKQKGPWFLVQASPFVGWMHGNSLMLRRGTKPRPASPALPAEAALSKPGSEVRPTESDGAKTKTEQSDQADQSDKRTAETKPPETDLPQAATKPSPSEKRIYIRGPRGGCYYVAAGRQESIR